MEWEENCRDVKTLIVINMEGKELSRILETSQLTKIYGKKYALDSVSIHVEQGDIYGLVGRNGAGKTTLMKIVSGLANASSGEYSFFGKTGSEIGEIAGRRGMLIESPAYFACMDGTENLWIKCMSMGVKDKNEPKRLMELVGLADAGKKHVKKYSFGMKQRLGLAMAMVGHPDLVVLDEPINGLDPQGISDVRNIIRKNAREEGTTFLISSHILDELSKVATRYGIINEGRLVEESSSEELLARCEAKLTLVTDNAPAATTVIEKLGFSSYKVLEDGQIDIYEQLERVNEISIALAAEKIAVLELVKRSRSLENYYINLVSGKDGE